MIRLKFYLVLFLLLFLFLIIVVPVYLIYINMKFVRSASSLNTPADFGMRFEALDLVSYDGIIIKAWHIAGDTKAPCVLMVHGKGGSKAGLLHLAAVLHAKGYHIIMPDLRGHGESGDALTTFGFNEARDVQAAFEAARRRPEIDTEKIGVYAQSMGACAAILGLADRGEIKGFFIDSGFDNLEELLVDVGVNSYGLPRRLAESSTWAYRIFTGVSAAEVDPAGKLAVSYKPVLMLHSPQDETIPFARARALYDKVIGRKKLIEVESGHASGWNLEPERYASLLTGFFTGVFEDDAFDPNSLESERLAWTGSVK